jgi:hypothetical protein
MSVISRKLSTLDTFIYDESEREMYIVESHEPDASTDAELLNIARTLVQQGRGVALNRMQQNHLSSATKHIAILT